MFYLIQAGQVIAKISNPEDVLGYKTQWIESDDDSFEPYKTKHIDGQFVKDTYIDDSLALLLKLAKPVEAADIAIKQDILTKLGVSDVQVNK